MAGQFQPSPNTGASTDVLSNFGSGAFGGSYKPSVASTGTSQPIKSVNIIYDYGVYRRVGDSLEIFYNYSHSGAAGTVGQGNYLFPLPGTLTVDQVKLPSVSYVAQGLVGWASTQNVVSGTVSFGYVAVFGATQLILFCGQTSQVLVEIGANLHGYGNTSIKHSFGARFPVSGWSSTDL